MDGGLSSISFEALADFKVTWRLALLSVRYLPYTTITINKNSTSNFSHSYRSTLKALVSEVVS